VDDQPQEFPRVDERLIGRRHRYGYALALDDGVLMGFVYDPTTDRTDLMLLDAGSMETVAAIHLPTRVPAGFHGNWVPAQ
jgi:carotenoid cleavage dioxygenase